MCIGGNWLIDRYLANSPFKMKLAKSTKTGSVYSTWEFRRNKIDHNFRLGTYSFFTPDTFNVHGGRGNLPKDIYLANSPFKMKLVNSTVFTVRQQLSRGTKDEKGFHAENCWNLGGCCCCLPCNHCSNWSRVVGEILALANRLRSTHFRSVKLAECLVAKPAVWMPSAPVYRSKLFLPNFTEITFSW